MGIYSIFDLMRIGQLANDRVSCGDRSELSLVSPILSPAQELESGSFGSSVNAGILGRSRLGKSLCASTPVLYAQSRTLLDFTRVRRHHRLRNGLERLRRCSRVLPQPCGISPAEAEAVGRMAAVEAELAVRLPAGTRLPLPARHVVSELEQGHGRPKLRRAPAPLPARDVIR
jgi:hypothetical protein